MQALRLASLLEIVELLDPFLSLEFNSSFFDDLFFDWESTVLDVLEQLEVFLQIETIFGLFEFVLLEVLDYIVHFLDDLLYVDALV